MILQELRHDNSNNGVSMLNIQMVFNTDLAQNKNIDRIMEIIEDICDVQYYITPTISNTHILTIQMFPPFDVTHDIHNNMISDMRKIVNALVKNLCDANNEPCCKVIVHETPISRSMDILCYNCDDKKRGSDNNG